VVATTLKRCWILLVVLGLSACASTPLPSGTLAEGDFRVSGKLAWQMKDQGDSARFTWQYQPGHSRWQLLTPLGSVAATIDAQPGRVVLDSEQGQFTASSLEALTLRLFDFSLPLTGMEYWVRAQPIPDQDYQFTQEDETRVLHQNGWRIRFLEWDALQPQLPAFIQLDNQQLKIKLRLKEWELPPPRS
jgi:outer membrane lipoprotein LolB